MTLWSDDDSRELDERIRAMRKPKASPSPALSHADARKVASRPVTGMLDSTWLMSRGRRRVIKERFEQTQLKRQLEAAGVTVPEPPSEPDSTPSTPARLCVDCGADISDRGPTAVRCVEHAAAAKRNRAKERDNRVSREEQEDES